MHEAHTREPFFHIVKRDTIPVHKAMLIRVIAVLAALLLCSVLSVLLIEANPFEFLWTLFDGSFGSKRRLWKFAKEAAILLLIALAITPAFRMRFWNIGAEGQTLIGALAAVAVIYYVGDAVPEGVLLLLMLLAAVLAGIIWAVVPAICKALWGTNETLFTLMMNYVATGLVSYFLVLWTPSGSSVLGALPLGHMPILLHEYFLPIVISLLSVASMYVYLRYTKQGYEVAVVGESENTARYIGINVSKVIVRTMLISGMLCGLTGFIFVAALDHSINTATVGGMGFTAIMVSWLAKFNPLIMIGTAAFVTFLDQGAAQVTTAFNVDSSFPDMVVGIVLFFIIGCEFFIGYRLKFRNLSKKGGEEK